MLSGAYSPDCDWIVFSKATGANKPDVYPSASHRRRPRWVGGDGTVRR
jgi:hypothetical protein